jgi:HSP20 family molecular chaperone IbpA
MSQATSTGGSVLTRQIRQLSAHFARIRDQAGAADGSGFTAVHPDDDYLYLEVEISGQDDLEVDISIWDGRAVIRIGR